MLRIPWILLIVGALLAIALLALAFRAPDGLRLHLMPNAAPVRGAIIERSEHPEWRQFLILGAIQRANELNRLRELPDTPARADAAPAAPMVAGLPADRSDSDPEDNDETGLNVQSPAASVPIDLGASFSIEVPAASPEEKPLVVTPEEKPMVAAPQGKPTVAVPEEKPTVITTPRRVKSRNESRIKGVQQARSRARAPAKREPPPPHNFFEPFGNQQTRQTPAFTTNNDFGNQQARRAPNPNNYFGNQQSRQAPNVNNYFSNQQTGQTETPNASNY